MVAYWSLLENAFPPLVHAPEWAVGGLVISAAMAGVAIGSASPNTRTSASIGNNTFFI
jgi:hypothetical protein